MTIYQVVAVCQWRKGESDCGLYLTREGAEERKREEMTNLLTDDWKIEIREREVK